MEVNAYCDTFITITYKCKQWGGALTVGLYQRLISNN